jgi:nucleoside permease NupC
MTTIMSLVGIVTLFGLALLVSSNRRHHNYRTLGRVCAAGRYRGAHSLANLMSAVLAGPFVSLQAP